MWTLGVLEAEGWLGGNTAQSLRGLCEVATGIIFAALLGRSPDLPCGTSPLLVLDRQPGAARCLCSEAQVPGLPWEADGHHG